jgi:hypothetical protein
MGGKALKTKIKKMSLEARFKYLSRVVDSENLNPISSKFLKSNFFNEFKAMKNVLGELKGYQYLTQSLLSKISEEYLTLKNEEA